MFSGVVPKDQEAIFQIRAYLATMIIERIREIGITQKEAAKRSGVAQPRISEIKKSKIDKFSVESLLRICHNLGIFIEVNAGFQALDLTIKVER